MSVDVFKKEDLSVLLYNSAGVHDQNGNRTRQVHLLLLSLRKCLFDPIFCPPWIVSQYPYRQRLRIFYTDTSMTEIATRFVKGRLFRGRVQVHAIVVRKNELHKP